MTPENYIYMMLIPSIVLVLYGLYYFFKIVEIIYKGWKHERWEREYKQWELTYMMGRENEAAR